MVLSPVVTTRQAWWKVKKIGGTVVILRKFKVEVFAYVKGKNWVFQCNHLICNHFYRKVSKSGSRNQVREKWLTRKKGGFIP